MNVKTVCAAKRMRDPVTRLDACHSGSITPHPSDFIISILFCISVFILYGLRGGEFT